MEGCPARIKSSPGVVASGTLMTQELVALVVGTAVAIFPHRIGLVEAGVSRLSSWR